MEPDSAVGQTRGVFVGYAQHVGRVGALAVALGIGTALIATPGLARADDTTSGTADSSPSAQPSTDPLPLGNTSPPAGTPGQNATTTTTTTTSGVSGSTVVVGGSSSPSVTFSHSGGLDNSSQGTTQVTSTPTLDQSLVTAPPVQPTTPNTVAHTTTVSPPPHRSSPN